MGAALAAPGRTVVSLTGDGGFNMMLGELETARRWALLHDRGRQQRASGYVKALQHLMYGEGAYHASDLARPTTPALRRRSAAPAFGSRGPGEVGPALRRALATKGPVVVDVVVTRDPAKMLPAADNRPFRSGRGIGSPEPRSHAAESA
jgi:acetolactate synthase-1/2/3 large subunit